MERCDTSKRTMYMCVRQIRLHAMIWVMLAIFLCTNNAFASLEAYNPVEFANQAEGSEFSHFAIDQRTNDIYIGGKDVLYHVNSDLTLHTEEITSPDPAKCGRQCENYNRILTVIPPPVDRLVTCGSYSRTCQLRNLANISESVQSANLMINSQTSAVGVVGQSDSSDSSFYVGVGPQFPATQVDVQYVTRWSLQPTPFVKMAEINKQIADAVQVEMKLNFVNGFSFEGFTYFVTTQQQLIGGTLFEPPSDHPFVSKINRVCEMHDDLQSFTEVPIECSVGMDATYNLIQAIAISRPAKQLAESLNVNTSSVLYAVFAASRDTTDNAFPPSALCMYTMTEVQEKFVETVYDCLAGNDDGNNYKIKHLPAECPSLGIPPELAKARQCDTGGYWQYAAAEEPLKAEPVIQFDGILATSVTTAVEEDHTVAFIGTSTGNLLKVHISDSATARQYEEVQLGTTSVQQDMYLNTTSDELYLLLEEKLVRLSVANCSQYTTCEDCIGTSEAEDGDPYCGWCTLEARCTRYRECERMNESTRWLPFSSDQCVEITNTSLGYGIPRSTPSQEIRITVTQLPVLQEGFQYECHFGDYVSMVTALNGSEVTCRTPPKESMPIISSGQSDVTVALSIFSRETGVAFVKADFTFYDCSLISSCSSCMRSPWACNWCVYNNTCTHDHDNTTCDRAEIIMSQDAGAVGKCPTILAPSEQLFLPVGVPQEILLNARNLPTDPDRVSGFSCVINIEGKEVKINAFLEGENTIKCKGTTFSYSKVTPEVTVNVSVVWNNKYVVDDNGIEVTLYNCTVDRESCSRCLSAQSTPLVLNCQWCGTICAFADSTFCTAANVNPKSQNSSAICDAPRITNITPRSGPIEGNTVVNISGTDLGQKFSDVDGVAIGNSVCSLDGMANTYDPGRSVSCRTSEGMEGPVTAKIRILSNNQLVNGTGGPTFNYEDPEITSVNPVRGIQAGGTKVTVKGNKLNTGSSISAMFANVSCFIQSEPTESMVMCKTNSSDTLFSAPLTLLFDGAARSSPEKFQIVPNPNLTGISTRSTISAGGSKITVSGSGFDAIQLSLIVVSRELPDSGVRVERTEPCSRNSTTLVCTSPPLPQQSKDVQRRRRRMMMGRRATDYREVVTTPITTSITFVMDGYHLPYGELEYHPNPEYYPFLDEVKLYATTVLIEGRNLNAASTVDDIQVLVGDVNATVVSLSETILIFTPPKDQPSTENQKNSTRKMPLVVVKHASLTFRIGYIDYADAKTGDGLMIIILCATAGVILIIIIVIFIIFIRNRSNYRKKLEHVHVAMQNLEDAVKNEATKAFFDIQQDMSGMKVQLQDLGGMPFVSSQDYLRNFLFVGLDVQPMTNDPQLPGENLTKAMTDFSKLLSNKDFLLVFIRSLDENNKLQMRDRNNIASLLTLVLVLEGKLQYLTDVMLTLMLEQINNTADNDRYRQLFRRTESIVEKILANWVALCMYSYLQKHVAYPLYLLYQAIKFQVEKGPIDIITDLAHFSLNYEYLLDENVEFTELELNVENRVQEMENNKVKVLDVDTITQVKEKVLDAMFRNKPLSARYPTGDVDLVLRSGRMGQLVLRDTDNTTDKPVPHWAKVNTIKHYRISDGAMVALVNKQENPNASLATPLDEDTELLPPSPTSSPKRGLTAQLLRNNTRVESDLEEGFQFFHLSCLYEDEVIKRNKRYRGSSSNGNSRVKHRKIKEIYLRRLVSTKKSIQTFVDDALAVMLSTSDERPLPKALKYLFDFFDRQSSKHQLVGAAELWKNSCLPMRFWVTALTHPAYVFDMNQTRTVDACVIVLTQMLESACKGIVPKYNFETTPSRVLYANEVPEYINKIDKLYEDICNLPRVNHEELETEFRDVCETFQGAFSHIGSLHQLYQFASKQQDVLIEALEEDEQCQRANMGYKLEQVGTTLAQGED